MVSSPDDFSGIRGHNGGDDKDQSLFGGALLKESREDVR
jgi:hypothetical protein